MLTGGRRSDVWEKVAKGLCFLAFNLGDTIRSAFKIFGRVNKAALTSRANSSSVRVWQIQRECGDSFAHSLLHPAPASVSAGVKGDGIT